MEFLSELLAFIPNILTGWIIPILFVLTLVVFFHELGHFLVARWCGVSVEAFSIGFGKELFGFTDRKNTRWKFCLLPLGGYVKFADDANPASTPDTEALKNLTEEQKAGSFHLKPLWKRALVVAAGPIASFILGILIFTGINYAKTQTGPSGYIARVLDGSAAESAGIKAGDKIIEINGSATPFFSDIYRIVSLSANEDLQIVVKRGQDNLSFNVKPRTAMVDNGIGKEISVGRIGVAPSEDRSTWAQRDYTLPGALVASVDQTGFIITSSLGYIGKIFTGRESTDKLNGPIGIGKIVNQFSEMGIVSTLYIAGLLSVSIGLFNLFPVPLLDGGHLMFYAIEAVRGRPASERFMEYSFRAGLVLLIGLMLLATKNDIGWFN
ncbi:MAG: putative zinc metalloprotease [Rhodomicrobium sp.]|nr:MAG: putative zinc metalloprotease [Rhodomicrobium sp.]